MFPWQCCFSNLNCTILFILALLDTYVPNICKNIDKPILCIIENLLVEAFFSFCVNCLKTREKYKLSWSLFLVINCDCIIKS
jgi:hypothetical protein